jgi:hypothetical protein
MKNKIIMIAFFGGCGIALSLAGGFGPIGEGSRKQNKEGDVLVSYDREGKGRYLPGVHLSVRQSENHPQQLQITNCLEFIDAKLDRKSGALAVVFNDGLNLVYQRYTNTNGVWYLSQSTGLVEYGLDFTLYGNRLELQDVNTVRASFIRKGEAFGKAGRKRGQEESGDKVHLIRIAEGGKVLIDNQERPTRQWRPDN